MSSSSKCSSRATFASKLAAATLSERLLRFEDRPDGGVAVIDGETGKLLTTMTGEQGFLRGAIRALARDRNARESAC